MSRIFKILALAVVTPLGALYAADIPNHAETELPEDVSVALADAARCTTSVFEADYDAVVTSQAEEDQEVFVVGCGGVF